jgi:hypothetical protein
MKNSNEINKLFLTSGVGNSLFQYLFARSLRTPATLINGLNQKNCITKLIGFDIHDFDIKNFDIPTEQWGLAEVIALFFLKIKTLREQKDHVSVKFFNTRYHFGYFQTCPTITDRSISDVNEVLRLNGFSISTKPKTRCVIHVRHGDFSPSERLGFDYYERAITSIRGLKHEIAFKILGFGADVLGDHLKARFGKKIDVELIPMRTEILDFEYIANSSVAISSNSTFCIWATLCGHPQTIVVPVNLAEKLGWQHSFDQLAGTNSDRLLITA